MTSIVSPGPGPELLYQRCREAGIDAALHERFQHCIANRWLIAPDVDLMDGFETLMDDADGYKALRLPDDGTLAGRVAAMTRIDRSELAFAMAEIGVSKAVLLRDFPDADAAALDAIAAAYEVRLKGRPPTARRVFKYASSAVQANVFIDCFVRRRAYVDFDPALFCECFTYAYGAYRYLSEGFADVLDPSDAWTVIESALSGRLLYCVCPRSCQPYFKHEAWAGGAHSPFLRFRYSQPSPADRSLMHMLDRAGCVTAASRLSTPSRA